MLPLLPENSKLVCDIPEYSEFIGYCMDINSVMYTCRKRQFGYYGKWIKLSHSIKNNRVCYCITNQKSNKYVLAHRILAMLFIPNPENKPWINHRDSNPLNNSISNIEWCTPKENSLHAVEFGFLPKGSCVKTSKLKESEVIEIRQKRKNGIKIKEIACHYDISVTTVEGIVANKTWKHIL